MPFGEGSRICIGNGNNHMPMIQNNDKNIYLVYLFTTLSFFAGMRTAMLQTMTGMIIILSEYEVSLNPKFANETSKRAIFTAPRPTESTFI